MNKEDTTLLLVVAGMWAAAIVGFVVKALRARGKSPAIWEIWRQPSSATLVGSYIFDVFLVCLVWGVFYFGWVDLWVAIAVTVLGLFWNLFFAVMMRKSREHRLPPI